MTLHMFKFSPSSASSAFSPFAPLRHHILLSVALSSVLSAACQRRAAPEPDASPKPADAVTAAAPKPAPVSAAKPSKPTSKLSPSDDPTGGEFTLDQATAGLTGSGPLNATIETELGDLQCTLYEQEAPLTVANFVGLARGTRPWKKSGQWQKTPLYDGTVFHRVVKGFMLQGGDPDGNGGGGPGYMIKNEIIPGRKHERGVLSMARRPDPDSAGSQFFVMDGNAPHLDGGYAIFGKCGPDAVIDKLVNVPVKGELAVTPTKIKTIRITRGK